MWGLVHSTFVTTPVSVIGLLASYSAPNEWCAQDGATSNPQYAQRISFIPDPRNRSLHDMRPALQVRVQLVGQTSHGTGEPQPAARSQFPHSTWRRSDPIQRGPRSRLYAGLVTCCRSIVVK